MSGATIVALAGRPNTGKTTLFNALTGLRQRVANFAGCTVEKAVGVVEFDDARAEIVDLPGTFSVLAGSSDEAVAFRFLSEAAAEGRDLRVLCVAEASNLQNDLALALSLRDAGYPVALAVNMLDEARLNGIEIDRERLSRELGMPVFGLSARSGEGIGELEAFVESGPRTAPRAALDLRTAGEARLAELHAAALREAEEIAGRCVRLPRRALLPMIERSIRIDRKLMHPVLGPLVLAATMFALFQALFAIGAPLQDLLNGGMSAAAAALRPRIAPPWLASLLCDGVLAGLTAVLGFVPQIAILFLLIGLLEHSGYLPRAGAMVDRALRPFGLDGKVFIPFLSSFACAIPGVMATRTIANENRRLTAILLAPLMTCSARIPVYTLLIAAFVPASFAPWGLNGQGLVMAAMYALGVLSALALALALRATPLYEEHPSPLTILPPYRLPTPRELGHYVWTRCRHFVARAGRVIFALSLLLWLLGSFPRHPGAADAEPARAAQLNIEHSALGRLGRAVEPAFRPLGYDWKISVAVLSSLAAREVFVGTLGTLFALGGEADEAGLVEALHAAKGPDGLPRYGLPTAVSLLLFFALAMQCISTIAVVRRETGSWRWPLIQIGVYTTLAYAAAFAGYRLTAALL